MITAIETKQDKIIQEARRRITSSDIEITSANDQSSKDDSTK